VAKASIRRAELSIGCVLGRSGCPVPPPVSRLHVTTQAPGFLRGGGELEVGREQGEGAALDRRHDPEVALIEGEQTARPMTMRQNDHREVGEAEVQVHVTVVQARDQAVLLSSQSVNLETSFGQVGQEGTGRTSVEAPAQHVVDLGAYRPRDDQRPGLVLEDSAYLLELGITTIGEGDQRSGVNDEGQLPNPCRKSSSGRSATDWPSPSADPVRLNRR
jgi:hypothetical protein